MHVELSALVGGTHAVMVATNGRNILDPIG